MRLIGPVMCATLLAMVGCGFLKKEEATKGGEGGKPTNDAPLSEGVVVDPYVVGARLFADLNGNGTFDGGEPLSSVTDAAGRYTFSVLIPEGTLVALKDKGFHGGAPYQGALKARLKNGGVVSPLTTLLALGLSAREVVAILAQSGLSLAEEDLTRNPVASFEQGSDVLQRAALSVHLALTKIGYSASPSELQNRADVFSESAGLVKKVLESSALAGAAPAVVLAAAVDVVNHVAEKLAANTVVSIADAVPEVLLEPLLSQLKTQYENNPGKEYVISSAGTVVAGATASETLGGATSPIHTEPPIQSSYEPVDFPAPTGLSVENLGTKLAFRWNSVPGAEGYFVARSLSPDGPWASDVNGGEPACSSEFGENSTTCIWTFNPVDLGGKWYFAALSRKGLGHSMEKSNVVNVTLRPNDNSIFIEAIASGSGLTLTWAGPGSGETLTGWKVFWRVGTSGSYTEHTPAVPVSSTPQVEFANLTRGQIYNFKVVKFNEGGAATYGDTASFATPPLPPSSLSSSSLDASRPDGAVAFSHSPGTWRSASGSKYGLYVASAAEGFYMPLGTSSDANSSFVTFPSALLPGKTYHFRVSSITASGESELSEPISLNRVAATNSIAVADAPLNPTCNATRGSSPFGQMTVGWTRRTSWRTFQQTKTEAYPGGNAADHDYVVVEAKPHGASDDAYVSIALIPAENPSNLLEHVPAGVTLDFRLRAWRYGSSVFSEPVVTSCTVPSL